MRTIRLAVFFVVLALASAAYAQSPMTSGVLTSATCPGTGCINMSVSGMGSASIQVANTYSGTVSFEVSVSGSSYSALSMTPAAGGSTVTSTTSTGVWTAWIGGDSIVRARMSSYTSGTASVAIGGALGLAAPGLSGVVLGNGVQPATAVALPNDATKYLDGTGAFTVPPGSGGGITIAAGQVAVGSGADTIVGSAALTWTLADGLGLSADNPMLTFQNTTSMQSDAYTRQFNGHDPDGVSDDTGLITQASQDGMTWTTILTQNESRTWVLGNTQLTGGIAAFTASNVLPGVPNDIAGSLRGLTFASLDGGEAEGFIADFIAEGVEVSHGIAHNIAGLYVYPPALGDSGVIKASYGIWTADLGGSGVANPYYSWMDSQGVLRFKEDESHDSVGQAVLGFYDPLYAKYIAGAAFFERYTEFWDGNVMNIGTEAGTAVTLTSLTSSATTATATLVGMNPPDGASVTISGAAQAEYNGTYTITRIDADSFSYTFAGSGTTPATGTITAQGGTVRPVRIIGTDLRAAALTTTGAATGKTVVCVDTSTGKLYASTSGVACAN